jgi:hypothetical protein
MNQNQELVTEPEIYIPCVDETGNYVDKIPVFSSIQHGRGIRCSCGSRKDKVYESYGVFSQHTKTKHHRAWLAGLNQNKANYYAENIDLKKTVQNQRLIIAELDRTLQTRMKTIDILTRQLMEKQNQNQLSCSVDLLEFN